MSTPSPAVGRDRRDAVHERDVRPDRASTTSQNGPAMYGHALELLARCACGLVASFLHDSTNTPCCRTCYEKGCAA